jgi:hypothetical protein
MGQRDGFAQSDIAKINKMYQCSGSYQPLPAPAPAPGPAPVYPSGPSPVRPPAGPNPFVSGLAQVIGGLGGFFHALGGKHDEIDHDFDNSID